jgi:hypothetical protein
MGSRVETRLSAGIRTSGVRILTPSVRFEGTGQLTSTCTAPPSAKHVVTTAGKPSGMAATASATAILK